MKGRIAATNLVIVNTMPTGANPDSTRIQSVKEYIARIVTHSTPLTRMAFVGERQRSDTPPSRRRKRR
jgi:hypothetical protein